jgi:hypothetical protein
MNKCTYVYTIDNRIVWFDTNIFYVPVLNDLHRIYEINLLSVDCDLKNCIHYIVKDFHQYSQREVHFSPLVGKNVDEYVLHFEKVKSYVKLCEIINQSYQSSLPHVFQNESEKIELLANVIQGNELHTTEQNLNFVNQLIQDKKLSLKKKYTQIVHQLKNAATTEEISNINLEINFNRIHIV